MKTFRNILALTVLLVAFALNADTLEKDMWLPDGTKIPAGTEQIQSNDLASYEYRDSDGNIIAQSTDNGDGTTTIFVKKSTGWVKIVVSNGSVTSTESLPASFSPTPITPLTTADPVSGSGNVIAPNGVLIPNSPASVV